MFDSSTSNQIGRKLFFLQRPSRSLLRKVFKMCFPCEHVSKLLVPKVSDSRSISGPSRSGSRCGHLRNGILAAEVLQNPEMALSCCMGSQKKYASHAAWECQFRFLQHLCSENAIFDMPQTYDFPVILDPFHEKRIKSHWGY